ncbi:hypothetical protein ACFYRC_38165 [Streptomyces sp. NPDC005279]|uniref:hypothetical protein n=1 Tax=Streptomyces sp. NPDC005279 TaxID=3364712 RepID=UPI00367CF9DC
MSGPTVAVDQRARTNAVCGSGGSVSASTAAKTAAGAAAVGSHGARRRSGSR